MGIDHLQYDSPTDRWKTNKFCGAFVKNKTLLKCNLCPTDLIFGNYVQNIQKTSKYEELFWRKLEYCDNLSTLSKNIHVRDRYSIFLLIVFPEKQFFAALIFKIAKYKIKQKPHNSRHIWFVNSVCYLNGRI